MRTDVEGYPTERCRKRTTPTGQRRHAKTCRTPFCPKLGRVPATRSAAQPGFHQLLEQGRHMLSTRGQIFILCRYGFHRSVGLAEILANELQSQGHAVQVTHHTIHKHAERNNNSKGKSKGFGKSKDVKKSVHELREIIFKFGHDLDCRALRVPDGDDSPPGLQSHASDEDGPPESDDGWIQAALDEKDRELIERDREIELLQSRLAEAEGQAQSRPAQATARPAPPRATRPIQPAQVDSVQDRTQKRLADEKLKEILQDRRFEYMRDFCVYSKAAGQFHCKLCLKWCPENQTRITHKELTPEHLNSHGHLNLMSRHYHTVGNQEESDKFWSLMKYFDQKRPRTG